MWDDVEREVIELRLSVVVAVAVVVGEGSASHAKSEVGRPAMIRMAIVFRGLYVIGVVWRSSLGAPVGSRRRSAVNGQGRRGGAVCRVLGCESLVCRVVDVSAVVLSAGAGVWSKCDVSIELCSCLVMCWVVG